MYITKAKELVDKFYQTTPNDAWINEPLGLSKEYTAWEQAKECALIAVIEIVEELKRLDKKFNLGLEGTMQYWEKVKTEIIKL